MFLCIQERAAHQKQQGLKLKSKIEYIQNQLNQPTSVAFSLLEATLRCGIEDISRPQIWMEYARIQQVLVRRHAGDIYEKLRSLPSPHDTQILRDTPRTCGIGSQEQQKLFNILRAYANYDVEVGYTQGMNYIACTVMRSLEHISWVLGTQECASFWMMIQIMFLMKYREIYKDSMVGALLLFDILGDRIKQYLPLFHEHMIKLQANIAMCFDCFIFSLCQQSTPYSLGIRVIDLFLVEGQSFMIEFIIRILTMRLQRILQLNELELLIPYLKQQMVNECVEILNLQNNKNNYQTLIII